MNRIILLTSCVVILFLFFIFFQNLSFSSSMEGETRRFSLSSGEKQFEINVKKKCVHNIGILFKSDRGSEEVVKIFGNALNVYMPTYIDIELYDYSGKIVFSIYNLGGKVKYFGYGPNPIMIYAGEIYINPGKYNVKIKINKIEEDLSMFESEFFIVIDPKSTCGSWFFNMFKL